MRLPNVVALVLSGSIAACATGQTTLPSTHQVHTNHELTCSAMPAELQERALQLSNLARRSARYCGNKYYRKAAGLIAEPMLEKAAQQHAFDMASKDFFNHTGSDGSTVGQRATNAKYSWQAIGENIAAGQRSVEEVVAGWLASPSHCSNIMNPDYQHMVLRCETNAQSELTRYWVQVFGKKLP